MMFDLPAVPRAFYRRDARCVAPDLLNKILVRSDGRAGRIVEVEAYCGVDDPAAHSFKGRTARNATMFGEPGHLYVYFTYGMHFCANAVAWDEHPGSGILIRALEPVAGLDLMRAARGQDRPARLLCSGPARLAQALGISRALDGADLVSGGEGCRIVDDGTPPPGNALATTRIGLSKARDYPWRWLVPGNAYVSRPPVLAPP